MRRALWGTAESRESGSCGGRCGEQLSPASQGRAAGAVGTAESRESGSCDGRCGDVASRARCTRRSSLILRMWASHLHLSVFTAFMTVMTVKVSQ